jgi:hypothetical protein
MKVKGFGGVEIMSYDYIYKQGNIEFGSDEFFEMVNYTVCRAQELGMMVTPPLGPGWNLGNAWVPKDDRSKALVISEQEVSGGRPAEYSLVPPAQNPYAHTEKILEAVVAVRLLSGGVPDCGERVDLSDCVEGSRDFSVNPELTVRADLPKGKWKLMTFWTAFSGQKCACENYTPKSALVDHLDSKVVRACADTMGGKYRDLFGQHFGQTVDSFFNDSFELHQDFTLWSTGLFERFQREKGYDLRPWLPMLKYDGSPEAPYVRYDVGEFLHGMGMEGVINTLSDYAAECGMDMRLQPHYRFTTELIEASGRLQRPETEFTRRSFDPSAYPHKLTVSGAQLYPSGEKRWTSAESFTFINNRYRTTMEQIKCASDVFLRDGITQFYNHGYFYTPEKEIAPSRDFTWMNRISHVNSWWPWFRGLADYQARAAFLLRQGRAEADVLLYSPMPTVWSERASFPFKNVRDIPFGTLPKILVASGYDFDCVNDDLLQNHATVEDGKLEINGYAYSVLILPRVRFLAPETLAKIEQFVRAGGTVFALNTLPDKTTGWMDHEERDKRQAQKIQALFEPAGGIRNAGRGATFFLPDCDGFSYLTSFGMAYDWRPTEPLTPAYAEFIKILRGYLVPDVEIADTPLSNGLTFRHTQIGDVDCWFICNLQPNPRKTEITLNTKDKVPQVWDAMDKSIRGTDAFKYTPDGRVCLKVDLDPWESQFVLLAPERGLSSPRQMETGMSLPGVGATGTGMSPLQSKIELSNPWNVSFQGLGNFETNLTMQTLSDWTSFQGLENFSGTAVYSSGFQVSSVQPPLILSLGEVCDVATVVVNGEEAGQVWMHPYRVDISKQVKPGKNELQVIVANRLWNHVSGLDAPKPVPKELQAHYSAEWNTNFNGWATLQRKKKNFKYDRLPSGLLGPVTLQEAEKFDSKP